MLYDVSAVDHGTPSVKATHRVPTFHPYADETIPCKGEDHRITDPEDEFPRKVVWQALFGKKRCLPPQVLEAREGPFAGFRESWKDDPTPVSIGAYAIRFFQDFLEIEKTLC